MGLLSPLALTFAVLSIPILMMYMLRLERREILVSSTLLWQRLVRDHQANVPWQRIRRNLLLLLQLLALALLTLALARPFVTARMPVSGNLVILLDASASMQATDVVPNRFEAARRIVRDLISALESDHTVTIISVSSRPEVLASATGDRSLLRRAIDKANPTNGPADWHTAFALTASLAGIGNAQVLIISDGALPDTLPPIGAQVRFISVGSGNNNCAITALAVRTDSNGTQAFLRIANFDDEEADLLVELSADNALFDARRVHVPAHGDAGLTIADLPYNMRILQAHLAAEDSLQLDNTAWAVYGAQSSKRVLLLSRGNLFLERALSAFPGIELIQPASDGLVTPDNTEGYALYVCDGIFTNTLQTGNMWLIAPPLPPTGERPVRGRGVFTNTQIKYMALDDPLLRHVDLRNVHILRAHAIEPPPGARVLVEAEGGPLLYVVERPEGRQAVLTFDLHDSDLPLQIAFPILTANLLNWLMPAGEAIMAEPARPGDTIPLRPEIEAEKLIITAPDGTQIILPAGESPLFADTKLPGVYRVQQIGHSGSPVSPDTFFAINLFDENESDITPRAAIWIGQNEVPGIAQEKGCREFWLWPAILALGVLIIEWWVYSGTSWSDMADRLLHKPAEKRVAAMRRGV